MEASMAGKIFEQTFNREAAELKRKLRLGRGYLLRDGRSDGWNVWSCRNGFAKPVGKAAGSLVAEMEVRELLKARPGGGLLLAQEMAALKTKIEIADPDGRIVTAERNETECALGWLQGRKDHAGGPL